VDAPFFEPPEPFLPEPPGPRPPWFGRPDNVLGSAVPVELLLARTPDVAVTVTGVVAYAEGFELTCSVRLRHRSDPHAWPFDLQGPTRPPFKGGELPPDLLRFGLQYSDGAKATSVGPGRTPPPDPQAAPQGPVLMPQGGGGGGHRWEHQFWVWPVPPPGELTFVCEWPAEGIPLTRVTVDAGLIRAAAERAEVLWPLEDDGWGDAEGTTVREYHSPSPPRSDA
jgi:hypothetical protein